MATLELMKGVPVDGYLEVSVQNAQQGTQLLASKEGVFVGFSSGANLVAALQLLDGPLEGGNVLIVICDSGLKYFSTELW